jgi:hypothetical protein
VGAASTGRGVFAAMGLPAGLRMTPPGVILGHVRKNTAGAYQVTVTFTQDGVTASQTFDWTILPAPSGKEDNEQDQELNNE